MKILKLSLLLTLATSVVLAQNEGEKLPDSLKFTVRKDYRPDTRDAKKHAVNQSWQRTRFCFQKCSMKCFQSNQKLPTKWSR